MCFLCVWAVFHGCLLSGALAAQPVKITGASAETVGGTLGGEFTFDGTSLRSLSFTPGPGGGEFGKVIITISSDESGAVLLTTVSAPALATAITTPEAKAVIRFECKKKSLLIFDPPAIFQGNATVSVSGKKFTGQAIVPAGAHNLVIKAKAVGTQSASVTGFLFIEPLPPGGGGGGGGGGAGDGIFRWDEPVDGDWNNPERWNPEGEPGSQDTVEFGKPSDRETGYGVFSTAGRSVAAARLRKGFAQFGFDFFVIEPKGLTVGNGGKLGMASGELTTTGARVGFPGGGRFDSEVLIGRDATWDNAGGLDVGIAERGRVQISGSARLTKTTRLGAAPGAQGALEVGDTAGLTAEELDLGAKARSKGSLRVAPAADVFCESLVLAGGAGSRASVVVDDTADRFGGELAVSGTVEMGGRFRNGAGSDTGGKAILLIGTGGSLTARAFLAGNIRSLTPASSSITLRGAGPSPAEAARLQVLDRMEIGIRSPVDLDILNGSFATAPTCTLGPHARVRLIGSRGEPRLDAPAQLAITGTAAGQELVLRGGSRVTVANGGAVTARQAIRIGGGSPGTALLSAAGAGARNASSVTSGTISVGGTNPNKRGGFLLNDATIALQRLEVLASGELKGHGKVKVEGGGPRSLLFNAGVIHVERFKGPLFLNGDFEQQAGGTLIVEYAKADGANDVFPAAIRADAEFVGIRGRLIVKCKDFTPKPGTIFRLIEDPGGDFDTTSLPQEIRSITILDSKGRKIPVNNASLGPNFFDVVTAPR